MIGWLYRKFVLVPLVEGIIEQLPKQRAKLDDIELPTIANAPAPYYFDPKTPDYLVPPVVQLLRDMDVDGADELEAHLNTAAEIDLSRPRMRCYPSTMYRLGAPVLEETWLCQSKSAQGYGLSMVHAYFDWAMRLSRIERDARGIHLEF